MSASEQLRASCYFLQFAAVLNESKKKCREWQAKAQQAEERLENVRLCMPPHPLRLACHAAKSATMLCCDTRYAAKAQQLPAQQ
jgi:hypothetical protein